jgi:hypothetical protein
MTPAQYKTLNDNAKAYYATLDLATVKNEFLSSNLLNRNQKLEKGDGVQNFGLELAPSMFGQNEKNMCGMEGQCLFTCLAFSGVANMMKSKTLDLSAVLKKRLRRTFLFLNDQSFFTMKLKMEVALLASISDKIALRLNVFSDLDWSKLIELSDLENVICYDYTKHKEYLTQKKSFTYSASEKDSDSDLVALLGKGFNVAMVFASNKLPLSWNGFEVIDGDEHDRRYEDKKGVIVGLKQKSTIGGKHKTKFTDRKSEVLA